MKWSRGKLLGRGSSATVSLAKPLHGGEIFAVKSVESLRSGALRREQEIHSNLKCDRIIDYKGYDVTHEDGKVLYNIFLEYASGGTLIDAVYEQGGGLSDSLVRRYTGEILRGLEYLHCSKGMVHCDIKGANILVTSEGVKIGDFGCCIRVDDDVAGVDLSDATIGGTPLYMAPEVARGEQQSYPADVWALGCTVFEMATGLSPWPDINHDPLSALYYIGFSGALPEIPGFLPDQAKDFLSQCLKRDPKERWTVAELLKHPFVIDDGPNNGPITYTPTSILDQAIWETMDQSPQSAQVYLAQERPTFSSSDRIKELMVDSFCEKFPNWTWEEDWITVRSNTLNDDEHDIISSGLGLHLGPNIQPNIDESFIVEPNFLFLSVELLYCCKDNTICSTSNSKKKSDEITKSKFICYCMNINFRLSNHGEFLSNAAFANFSNSSILL